MEFQYENPNVNFFPSKNSFLDEMQPHKISGTVGPGWQNQKLARPTPPLSGREFWEIQLCLRKGSTCSTDRPLIKFIDPQIVRWLVCGGEASVADVVGMSDWLIISSFCPRHFNSQFVGSDNYLQRKQALIQHCRIIYILSSL